MTPKQKHYLTLTKIAVACDAGRQYQDIEVMRELFVILRDMAREAMGETHDELRAKALLSAHHQRQYRKARIGVKEAYRTKR